MDDITVKELAEEKCMKPKRRGVVVIRPKEENATRVRRINIKENVKGKEVVKTIEYESDIRNIPNNAYTYGLSLPSCEKSNPGDENYPYRTHDVIVYEPMNTRSNKAVEKNVSGEKVLHHIKPHMHHTTIHHTIVPYTPHHTTSHHTIPHHITPYHITSHHTTSHHITSHHTKPNHIIPYHTTPYHTTSHHITSHHTTPNHTTPHQVIFAMFYQLSLT